MSPPLLAVAVADVNADHRVVGRIVAARYGIVPGVRSGLFRSCVVVDVADCVAHDSLLLANGTGVSGSEFLRSRVMNGDAARCRHGEECKC